MGLSGPTSFAEAPFRLLEWKHGTSLDPTRFLSSPMGITQRWSPASRSATSFFRADQEASTIQNSTKRAVFDCRCKSTLDTHYHVGPLDPKDSYHTHIYKPSPPVQIPPTQHKTSCCYFFFY